MDQLFETYLLDPYTYPEAAQEPFLDLLPPPSFEESSSPIKQRSPSHICKMIQSKKASNYYWTDLENNRYMQALKQYANILSLSPQERRLKKVNLLLSRKVRTRSPLQCHSHHQKMIAKYGSLEKVINQLELKAKQNGTLWGQGENSKRRGRPPKQSKVMIQSLLEPEVITVCPPSEDDLLFVVLELGKQDLEQQEVERWMEQQSMEGIEEDPAMGCFFWL